MAKSCIRLHSNVLDNNPDWAGPAHMRGEEVYAHLRLRMEWPPQRLIIQNLCCRANRVDVLVSGNM